MAKEQYEVRFAEQILLDFTLSLSIDLKFDAELLFQIKKTGLTFYQKKLFPWTLLYIGCCVDQF